MNAEEFVKNFPDDIDKLEVSKNGNKAIVKIKHLFPDDSSLTCAISSVVCVVICLVFYLFIKIHVTAWLITLFYLLYALLNIKKSITIDFSAKKILSEGKSIHFKKIKGLLLYKSREEEAGDNTGYYNAYGLMLKGGKPSLNTRLFNTNLCKEDGKKYLVKPAEHIAKALQTQLSDDEYDMQTAPRITRIARRLVQLIPILNIFAVGYLGITNSDPLKPYLLPEPMRQEIKNIIEANGLDFMYTSPEMVSLVLLAVITGMVVFLISVKKEKIFPNV